VIREAKDSTKSSGLGEDGRYMQVYVSTWA
jgi:hypothetical protein